MKIDNFGSASNGITASKLQSGEGHTSAPAQVREKSSEQLTIRSAKGEGTSNKDRSLEVQEESITPEMMEQAVKQANKSLNGVNKQIERTVHETTHTIMYVLRDTVTKEVISEFPPKKIQDMIAKMWELAGLFVDEKA